MSDKRSRLSPFSVILVIAALMIVGAAMIPLLSVQLSPTQKTQRLSVMCYWGGASPSIMEREVISKLEGVLARLEGVEEITSTSNQDSGNITLTFKDGTRMDLARFEAASQIRYVYPQLPEGVSYPSLSLSTSGSTNSEASVLGYTITSTLPAEQTENYIKERIQPIIARMPQINSVNYGGIMPREYEITVDPNAAASAGVSMSQIASAFNNYFAEATIGNVTYGETDGNVILLKTRMNETVDDFGSIPVAHVAGRIIRLGDLAGVRYKQRLPSSYSRINGLDIIGLRVSGEKGSNVVKLSSEVKAVVAELEKSFPEGFTMEVNYDAADHINKELRTIFFRTLMTLVVLLLFVLAVSRNFAYLLTIFATLIANILIAMIFYYLLGLQIHLYSLAGIAVSLGIIIDTSIIMVDHYSYYRDRKAFLAILGAVLTTIASMSVIFLLPDQQKLTFGDFAWVIVINLSVSLLISLLFIPALLEQFPLRRPMTATTYRGRRLAARFNTRYSRFIGWSRRHKWIYITVLILGFGIPLHLLPAKLQPPRGEEPTGWMNFYNKTLGGKFYQENKAVFEKALGGSFRVFDKKRSQGNRGGYRDTERTTLTINAGMVEGNTVHQLNQIVRHMENYLTQFEEIESFRSNVMSYNSGTINVTFKPEYEKSSFPLELFENVKREAMKFGGATWRVYGVDPNQNFNNNVSSYNQYKPHRIAISGYNYDNLLTYAEALRDTLALNRRVSDPNIYGEVAWRLPQQEYFIDIDRGRAIMTGANIGGYFSQLNQLLYSTQLRSVFIDDKRQSVSLTSSDKDRFDLWNVKNFPLEVDSVKVKLSDFGTIDKEYSGLSIYKRNQSYQLTVAFDFIGSYELIRRVTETQIKRLNDEVLPIGYLARDNSQGWYSGQEKNRSFLLILLVIAIIYCICAILFESFSKPLVIILMIPVSFIGVFLTFGLFGFTFDQGGFASFILICGLVVNAGIYVVNEYNIISRQFPGRSPLEIYLKAYSRKIVPIMLTIISTILGLVPFIVNGKDDVFWYSFAVGTMGGMVFSIVAFLVFLPVFLPAGRKKPAPATAE